ncbi:MAG: hypothetical protein V4625_03565 [Pseudomonadota bacterium]
MCSDKLQFSLYDAFARASRVSRAFLYGLDADRQLPLHLPDLARTPYLGFTGKNYQLGGVCLIGINPGGGGDAYSEETLADRQLADSIDILRGNDSNPAHFEAMNDRFEAQFRQIPFKTIVNPVLEAADSDVSSCAYLNMFPYRTRGDKMPHSKALAKSCELIVEPLLKALRPRYIVILGYKARNTAEKNLSLPIKPYVIKRTIGDRVICPEAAAVIKEIAADKMSRVDRAKWLRIDTDQIKAS